jgi:hypothetical protein
MAISTIISVREAGLHALLRVRNRSTDAALGRLSGFGHGIVTRVEVLAILRVLKDERGMAMYARGNERTFCIFVIALLCVGNFPYKRKSFCSSSVNFCEIDSVLSRLGRRLRPGTDGIRTDTDVDFVALCGKHLEMFMLFQVS